VPDPVFGFPGSVNMQTPALQRLAMLAVSAVALCTPLAGQAQEKPWSEGTVWTVTMIRVKPGMFDVYMRDLLPMRKKINDEAKKQGLVLSSHVLAGNSSGRDDFDVMILEEYKNWAAFDGLTAKYEAMMKSLVGPEDKQLQIMTKRTEVREVMGEKVMQEIVTR
jgi:hypothetical protein